MRRVLALLIMLALLSGSLNFPVERVTAMVITDLDNDLVDDYILACHKIVSDPWDRGVIYIYKENKLKWYYHLSTVIKDVKAHDLDYDGTKEIIVACDLKPEKLAQGDKGVIYVFDINGKLKWRQPVPGVPKSLYCYEKKVAVNVYRQGERVMIFDSEGNKLKDLPVNGDISKFIIEDINRDGKKELIVSGVVNNKWEHFLVVYNMEEKDHIKRVLWNYETNEHINDFIFYDIDGDGILETLLGAYNTLYITRGGDLLGRIELPPPILHIDIFENQILVSNSNTLFLIGLSDVQLLSGETIPVTAFTQIVNSALPVSVKPEFLFLRDTDFDGMNEIISGTGNKLEIHELNEFAAPETVITVPVAVTERIITFSTYENIDYGIKIEYPKNWTVDEVTEPPVVVQFLSPREGIGDTFQENVTIAYEELPQPMTLQEYTESSINLLRGLFTEFNLIEQSDTTLAGNPAQEILYTGKMEGTDLKCMQVITLKDDKVYILTYTAFPTTYPRYLQAVQTMTESFEIVEKLVPISVCDAQFDAPGEDNDNLNGEWIKLCNDGDTDIDMTGWSIMNDMGNYFEFPDGFVLKAGSFVFIYTGSGDNTEIAIYWGSPAEVWNNFGDLVTLMDSEGNVVLEYELIPQ